MCERLAAQGYLAIAPDIFHRQADGQGDWQQAFATQRNEDSLADIRGARARSRSTRLLDFFAAHLGAATV